MYTHTHTHTHIQALQSALWAKGEGGDPDAGVQAADEAELAEAKRRVAVLSAIHAAQVDR